MLLRISEAKGSVLEIRWFEALESTQKRLVEDIKEAKVRPPIAYCTTRQIAGIGSRGNSWIGQSGNLFFSFAMYLQDLPKDLPLQSAALYFMFLLKEILAKKGSAVWLKWPNDLYIDDKKCGGCVTHKVGEILICGIGLNTHKAPEKFGVLDIRVSHSELLEEYFDLIAAKIRWKQIFSKYKVEFHKSKQFTTHVGNRVIGLEEASLAEDGALIVRGERIYTPR